MRRAALLSMLVVLSSLNLSGQAANGVAIHVKESAGIRRSGYPVNARVPFAKGTLKDPAHVRLMLNDREVAAQIVAQAKWPDESTQWLDVDFNATIAPMEEQTFHLEFGDDTRQTTSARGIAVSETDDAIQAGNVRFNKTKMPLVASIRYRQEDIGNGPTGFTVIDTAGVSHDVPGSDPMKAEVLKRGPIYVVIRYSGKVELDGAYSVPFTITVEMPSGKTWVKYSASVDDPSKRLREIVFNSTLSFGELPWLWDFGTGSWTYGSFRNPTESVVLTQVIKGGPAGASGNDWQVKSGPKGQEQPYEVASGGRPKTAEGWGHFQDGKEVIAFGFDKFGRAAGTYTVSFDGQGNESFRFASAQPAARHEITIYQHYVASPTPIGAVTSPVSMLYGLTATLDREQYVKAGVSIPK